jgi:hypothetical protein
VQAGIAAFTNEGAPTCGQFPHGATLTIVHVLSDANFGIKGTR